MKNKQQLFSFVFFLNLYICIKMIHYEDYCACFVYNTKNILLLRANKLSVVNQREFYCYNQSTLSINNGNIYLIILIRCIALCNTEWLSNYFSTTIGNCHILRWFITTISLCSFDFSNNIL